MNQAYQDDEDRKYAFMLTHVALILSCIGIGMAAANQRWFLLFFFSVLGYYFNVRFMKNFKIRPDGVYKL